MSKWLVLVISLFFLSGYAPVPSVRCSQTTDINILTSISNADTSTLGFPRDTIIVAMPKIPTIGNITSFEHKYLQVIARATKAARLDPASVISPVLPYASFDPSIYSEASNHYPSPVSVLIDSEGKKGLLVSISPARLLTLAAGKTLSCDGAPLVLNANTLNHYSGIWARDVLPNSRNSEIKRFTAGLPEHLRFLPMLLKNAGGGGFIPFTETVVSYTEQCLLESLPYLEALLTSSLSNTNQAKALSEIIATPSPELVSLQPACLKN